MSEAARVRLTTGQAVVRWLQAQHSERDGEVRRAIPAMFGLFGHGNVLGLAQGIEQEGSELPFYQPKNEQAMVHAAIGYAKASRRLATLACTASIGPGSTNMLTGAATATANRLPVLLLPSDTFANRRQGPVLQQLEHPVDADLTVNDAFRPYSRFFDRVARPEQLLTALPQAMRVLLDPAETGAVTVSLHQDVQGEAFDFPASLLRPARVAGHAPPAGRVGDRGGGGRAARRAPAARHRRRRRPLRRGRGRAARVRRGARDPRGGDVGRQGLAHRVAAGSPAASASTAAGRRTSWRATPTSSSASGTRLTDFTTGSHSLFQHPDVRFIGLNVNAADAHKLSATPVVADAREALGGRCAAQLAGWPRLRPRSGARSWRRGRRTSPRTSQPRAGEPLGQGEVLRVINETVAPGDWVVAAAGWQPGDLLKLWEAPAGTFSHLEFGFSCMGHEIPAGHRHPPPRGRRRARSSS